MFDTQLVETDSATKSVVDYKKSQHRRRILTELYRVGTCSIAHIARVLHNSVPSVTSIMEELTEEYWIQPVGTATTKQGRKPVMFSLNSERYRILLLDINTHGTKAFITNLNNEIIFQQSVSLSLEDNPKFLDTLCAWVGAFIEGSHIQRTNVIAIGVSIPGLIDTYKGYNFTYRSINKNKLSFSQFLEYEFKLPVYVINDAKAITLGEQKFGLAKGKKHVLSVNVDWGIGMGVILNGEILQGASGFAGELGHIQVMPNGELCPCGKIGCLETITSASAVIARVKKGLTDGRTSKLSTIDINKLEVEDVIEAARRGDVFAIDTLHEIGTELGKGLSIAIHLFNPEVVIIDGIFAQAEDFIINPIVQAINKYCLADFRSNLTVQISQLREDAKWLGTQVYVTEKIFQNQIV